MLKTEEGHSKLFYGGFDPKFLNTKKTFSEKDSTDDIFCESCTGLIRAAKSLPCGHRFCGNCLRYIILLQQTSEKIQTKATCSTCKEKSDSEQITEDTSGANAITIKLNGVQKTSIRTLNEEYAKKNPAVLTQKNYDADSFLSFSDSAFTLKELSKVQNKKTGMVNADTEITLEYTFSKLE